jgi:ATP-binding cassette subfamily B protein
MARMSHEETTKRMYKYTDREITRRLLTYTKPFLFKFAIVFLLMFIASLLFVYEPLIIAQSLDLIITDFDMSALLNNIGILAVAIIAGRLIELIMGLTLQNIGQSIIYNIRQEIFTHLETHDIAFLNSKPTGSLVTRVTNDTNTLNEMYTSVITSLISNAAKVLMIFGAMLLIDVRLTLYVMIVVPFIVLFSYVFRRFSRNAYRQVRANLSSVNAFLAEHLSGMKIIQIFNKEDIKFMQFDERNTKLKKSYYKQITVFGIFRPTMYLLYMVAVIIVYYFAGRGVLNGMFEFTVLFAFYQYIGRFFDPIQQLAEQFNVLQSAFASGERIFDILDTKAEVINKENPIVIEDIKGEIEFKNVWFQYLEDEWILQDISFKVNAKESVAFVGATGAGKTTILSLITRYYDIQKGQILIDGYDIKDLDLSSLRKQIGQMLQEVFMFSGTISSNIKLKNEEITDQEMIDACHYVNADHFINKLDNKYDEVVRERGNNYSSGQRQLLSFARTIVHKPSIMILDEATANIDTETEQLIQDSLNKMMSIGTMLIVAHRLSTIQHVDKIIVLSKGKIIEQGSHQELLKQKGHYYNLYKLQYQDQSKNDTK